MFDFKKKFIDNNKIDQFKLIVLHGSDESQIIFVLDILKEYFRITQQITNKELSENQSLIENLALTNDIFSGKIIYVIENIDSKHIKNAINSVQKFLDVTQNIFIIIYKDKVQLNLKNDLAVLIECNKLNDKDKNLFILSEIDRLEIKLKDDQKKFLSQLLKNEDIVTIKNEIYKLYLFSLNKDEIKNSEVGILFDIPDREEVNNLLRAVIYRDKNVFNIAEVIMENYSPLYLIRSLYNYFMNLMKVFLLMKIKKYSFQEATKTIYGILIDYDIEKLKLYLKNFKIPILENMIKRILDVEFNVKSKPNHARASCLKLLNEMVNEFNTFEV